ncbi:ArnT family glycosyltransferase [Gimesia panareensis]|nr:glycosyltransferase family 39 protein [Gimesia panareensis]
MMEQDPQELPSSEDRRLLNVGRALLGLSVLSWCLLMYPLLSGGPLVMDEHCSYWIIDSGLPGTSLMRSLDYAAIPPLSSWIQELFLTVLGKSELTFRLSSALCALGAIFITYLAGKELRSPLTGGLAALLVAWHPEAMDEVRIARCYGLVLMLGAAVIWATIRWQRTPRSLPAALFWSLSSIALLWTHYTSALLVILSGLAVAVSCWRKRDLNRATLSRMLLAVALLIVFCLPLVPTIFRLKEWGPILNFSGSDPSIWNLIGPFWWIGLPVGILFLLVALRRCSSGAISQSGLWMTGACSLLPLLMLAVLSSGEMSSLANPRYRVAYAPAGACFIALLLTHTRHWMTSLGATVVVLVAAWLLSPLGPWDMGRLGSPTEHEWRELNAFLSEHSKAGEPLLVQSGLTESYLVPVLTEDRVFLEYVACRVSRFYVDEPHPRYALPYIWNPQTGVIDFYRDLLESWKTKPGSFWVASATDTDLNQNSLNMIRTLAREAGYVETEQKSWHSAALLHFKRPSGDRE